MQSIVPLIALKIKDGANRVWDNNVNAAQTNRAPNQEQDHFIPIRHINGSIFVGVSSEMARQTRLQYERARKRQL